jgi:hypothetical protein
MTNDDIEKIKLVDQVFRSLSLDEIKSILSADLIVDKLKGTENSTGPILSAIQNLSMLQVEIIALRSDHIQLKEDFKSALKVMQTLSIPIMPATPYSSELQTLKSKYSVY